MEVSLLEEAVRLTCHWYILQNIGRHSARRNFRGRPWGSWVSARHSGPRSSIPSRPPLWSSQTSTRLQRKNFKTKILSYGESIVCIASERTHQYSSLVRTCHCWGRWWCPTRGAARLASPPRTCQCSGRQTRSLPATETSSDIKEFSYFQVGEGGCVSSRQNIGL